MSFGIRRRPRRADNFAQIDNAFLRDESISIEARGMGAYLLTHDSNFRVSAKQLAKACRIGRDKARRIVAELETAGYLVREATRDGGRFGETEYSMSDEKVQVAPVTENPAPVDQSLETRPHKNINSENTKEQEDHLSEGDTAAAAPVGEIEDALEEDVKLKPPADSPTLFEVAAPPKKKRKDRPQPSGSPAVVAAYVDSYVLHHNQQRPLKSDLVKVGAAAKLILTREEATEEELMKAATRMGRGEWSNLAQELKFSRKATSGQGISAPARGHDAPVWGEMEQQTRTDVPDMTVAELDEIFGVKA